MSDAMTPSHKPSMNLRFVTRVIHEHGHELGPHVAKAREIRVLQQMMVPKDWSKHDEYWQDVPCFDEAALAPNA